jgi:hypothetical protein
MKHVDFYKLPRAIQDRFVGSVMSGFPPAPILASKGGTPLKLMWLGLSAACFVLLVFIARLGYGDLESSLSLHSGKALILYLGLVFGLAFGLLQAFARVVRERALPYTAGIYLFPACLIDARDDQFRVYDTRDLGTVDAQGNAVRVVFGAVTFTFPLGKGMSAATIASEVQAARERAMKAHAAEDAKELVAVDPLHNPRFSSPVGPRDAYDMARPPWGKLGPAVAGGIAIVLGPGLWALRNAGSDGKMYVRAKNANDSPTYRLYMQHGDRHKQEIGDILLPTSELHDAERAGTVEALLAYKASHPASKIGRDVSQSIRRAMLAELEKAKEPGTLAALQAFAQKYPEHGVGAELGAATHAVYARELAVYKKNAVKKDPAAVNFIERLFAWAEKHGPKVEVRFRRKPSSSLERADQFVLKTPQFMGVITYPSRFFDDKHAAPREAALGKTLATQIDGGLADELFDVSVGNVVTEADLPEPTVPTLFITHATEWSGHNYVSTRPRGSYVGLNFNMEASWVIPGDAKPFKYKTEIFRHAATHVLNNSDEPMLQVGQAEEKVYETMATDAFDQFAKKLLASFFTPPAK